MGCEGVLYDEGQDQLHQLQHPDGRLEELVVKAGAHPADAADRTARAELSGLLILV